MLTYNQERYINEAIRSVMLQETNFPFELVIGNDASTDCTGTICADWQKKYPEQIVLFNRKKNLGLQQNFIQTYAQCRGQYIAICEGDDFWTDKRKLQIQADFLDTHPDYSTCFHRVINYYEDRARASAMAGRSRIQTYQTLHAAITSPTYPLCSAGACSANCPNGLPVSAPTTMPYIC